MKTPKLHHETAEEQQAERLMADNRAKHTPGHWRIGDAGHTVFGPPNDKPCPSVIATIHNPSKVPTSDEWRANGRLIAAAPELLAACEFACQWEDIDARLGKPVGDKLRAAIAKATGQ